MSTVEVYHGPVHVASVETPYADPYDALEFAWRYTQNISGSWSRPGNPDHRDAVTVRAMLPIIDGREYGLRSSMMGDRFIFEGVTYVVAACGFEEQVVAA